MVSYQDEYPGNDYPAKENDPTDPSTGGSGGGCAPGTFEIDIDASGKPKAAPDGECVDQAEASRRNKLWIAQNPGIPGEKSGNKTTATTGTETNGPVPPFNPGYKFAPVPKFEGLPAYQAPTLEQAMADPGYRFAADEGRRALDASAASNGRLRTGAQARSLEKYGQDIAQQQYSNVDAREFRNYVQKYQQALDMYSPSLAEWTLLSNAEIGGKNLESANMWSNYWNNNLTAAQLLQLLSGSGI